MAALLCAAPPSPAAVPLASRDGVVEGLKGREVLYVALRSAMMWLRVLDPWVIRSTADAAGAVSYTHLTLPTILRV